MEAYLDNSATTRPGEPALQAMQEVLGEGWHNPSALYKPAMLAQKRMEQARETCLKAAGAQGERLIFTGSGTEADNLAILGIMQGVRKPSQVLMLQVEHPAVLACAQALERMGHEVREIPVDGRGVCDLERLGELISEKTRLICVMQVNNVTGAVQPLEEIAVLRSRLAPEAAIHVDGVQGFLRVPLAFKRLGIQSYAFSGHKIHASKGIGGLICQTSLKLSPQVFGGGQEGGYRSGTENTPGIAGLGAAVASFPKDAAERMAELKLRLWEQLHAALPAAAVNGPAPGDPAAAPHILNVSFPPVRSQTLLFALEGKGVYVSAGSACASHKQKSSRVLGAMHIGAQRAESALRFSLSPMTTREEIDWAAACCIEQVPLLAKYVRR
jgi:cysteine desulfurase